MLPVGGSMVTVVVSGGWSGVAPGVVSVRVNDSPRRKLLTTVSESGPRNSRNSPAILFCGTDCGPVRGAGSFAGISPPFVPVDVVPSPIVSAGTVSPAELEYSWACNGPVARSRAAIQAAVPQVAVSPFTWSLLSCGRGRPR
jgi:hypothetical protein